jgi:hypothetical protein
VTQFLLDVFGGAALIVMLVLVAYAILGLFGLLERDE